MTHILWSHMSYTTPHIHHIT